MIDDRTAPYGVFLLRLALGVLFIAHASLKIFVFTLPGTAQFFGSLGLPPALGTIMPFWELAGAAALILGVWPRLAALLTAPILIGAILTVHGAAGFFFTSPNGGWEFPALWLLGLVSIALLGDGAFALVPTPVPGATEAARRTARA